jgi:hypothetical protein
VHIRKMGGSPPSAGGYGGNGGSGAIPGDIVIAFEGKTDTTSPVVSSLNGNNGVGGIGGTAGRTAPECYDAFYYCIGSNSRSTVLFGGVQVGKRGESFSCSLTNAVSCSTTFLERPNGNPGAAGRTAGAKRFKHQLTPQIAGTIRDNLCKKTIEKERITKLNQDIMKLSETHSHVKILQDLGALLRQRNC